LAYIDICQMFGDIDIDDCKVVLDCPVDIRL